MTSALVMFVPANAKGNELAHYEIVEWEGNEQDFAKAAAGTRNIASSWEIADILFEDDVHPTFTYAHAYDVLVGR